MPWWAWPLIVLGVLAVFAAAPVLTAMFLFARRWGRRPGR
jgi:hypothetical protein